MSFFASLSTKGVPLRFTITQLLMAVAMIGIGLLFLQSEGCGSTYHQITRLSSRPMANSLLSFTTATVMQTFHSKHTPPT